MLDGSDKLADVKMWGPRDHSGHISSESSDSFEDSLSKEIIQNSDQSDDDHDSDVQEIIPQSSPSASLSSRPSHGDKRPPSSIGSNVEKNTKKRKGLQYFIT